MKLTKTQKKSGLSLLVLGALGVVYGDIGTSPLYAINEIFFGHGKVPLTTLNVLGSISLVLWVLTLVVTFKYIVFVLLANHEGEGGVFALLGLLSGLKRTIAIGFLIGLLVLAAGLLFGDGLITPAISILSAIEGLSVATNIFNPYIIPITLAVLVVLFSFQYKGTKKIGIIFGPIMITWFTIIALLGLHQIILHPAIFYALNPLYALRLVHTLGFTGTLLVLGAVVLAVTGGEALYADLGHFGLQPIRISWLAIVFPALILNYMGQGAFLLGAPVGFHGNVFYSLVPAAFIYPMVILATFATIIASQALISGAFSLTAQAIALNFLPRFKISYTNTHHEGQIYVGSVNWILFVGSASLVLIFKSSSGLAAAYGLAVSGVMLATSLAMLPIAADHWKWGWLKSSLLFGSFAVVDFTFLFSNSLKFFEGGYVPVIIGLCVFSLMMTWNWGRMIIYCAYETYSEKRKMADLVSLKNKLSENNGMVNDERGMFVEVDRVVIFLVNKTITSLEDRVPVIVRSYMSHNGSIPRYTILLSITKEKVSHVEHDRYLIKDFGNNLVAIQARFGFMEDIQIHTIVASLQNYINIPGLAHSHYIIKTGREEFKIDRHSCSLQRRWLVRFFGRIQRFATPTYRYFGLNANESLSTTTVQINVSDAGGKVIMPELDLQSS
jgi:KUP system potassium uptake protein